MRYLITTILLLITNSISFADEPVSKGYWNQVAIGGVDTVAYHSTKVRETHREVDGRKQFLVKWKNANWHFASEESARRFAADPERYLPQYNGFCSNALSLDEGLIATEGHVWEFFADRLHLFYAERGRQRWLNGNWKSYQRHADKAWQQIIPR